MSSDASNVGPSGNTIASTGSEPAPAPAPAPSLPVYQVVGVQLAPGGRSLVFSTGPLSLKVGDTVVVPEGSTTAIGHVSVAPALRPVRGSAPRQVLRLAEPRDIDRAVGAEKHANEAVAVAREQARSLDLPIKVFHAEVAGGRTTLYFASDARIDFRGLVRELGTRLRTRIELRQVGVRDEAKLVGGIGSCGRELCCSTFLPRFAPVSIKMAKHQGLALNPAKVSGQCGRLKCCLVYEEANYVEAAAKLPSPGKRVETPEGPGRVADLDILRGRVRVQFPDRAPKVFEAHELNSAPMVTLPTATGAAGGAGPTVSAERRPPSPTQSPNRPGSPAPPRPGQPATAPASGERRPERRRPRRRRHLRSGDRQE